MSAYGDTICWGTADAAPVALDALTDEQRWELGAPERRATAAARG